MKAFKQYSSISKWQPSGGYSYDIMAMVEAGMSKEEMIGEWTRLGRNTNSFYKAVGYLRQRFASSPLAKEKMSETQQKRVQCWEMYSRFRSYLILDNKLAALDLAGTLIPLAERCGFIEVVRDVCLEVMHHYGAISTETGRYLRYRKKYRDASNFHEQQNRVIELFTRMVFMAKKRKDLNEIAEEVEQFEDMDTGSVKYLLYRCSLLSHWHQLNNNPKGVLKILRSTVKTFEDSKLYLPFVTRANLYMRLLPRLTALGEHKESEVLLGRALKLPKEGSYTWSLLMLQRAFLGFWSDKPGMVSASVSRVKSVKRRHDSEELDELWELMRAYQALSEHGNYRIRRFLNSVPKLQQEKQGANVALLIVELLHHLKKGDRVSYMKKAEGLKHYTHQYLRGKDYVRHRAILRMLVCVEDGDYHKRRVLPRAARWLKQLNGTSAPMVTSAEVLPFEMAWALVVDNLK